MLISWQEKHNLVGTRQNMLISLESILSIKKVIGLLKDVKILAYYDQQYSTAILRQKHQNHINPKTTDVLLSI